MGGVSGGGKGGGSMPQQQTPPSPGAAGQPQQYEAMRNSMMQAQKSARPQADMMRQQMMAMRNRPTGPVTGQPYSFGTPAAPATPDTAAPLAAQTPATGAPPPPQSPQQQLPGVPGGGQFADQAAANMWRQQNGMRGWGNKSMGGLGSLMANTPRTQQGMQQMNSAMDQWRGIGSLFGGMSYAAGGAVAAPAKQGWTPTGAGISPGTPSGPVVWNPNRFGGAAPAAGTPSGVARLPAIVAQKAAAPGVARYVAPAAVKPAAAAGPVKPQLPAWASHLQYQDRGRVDHGRGSHAGFGGTMGASGFSGRGGGGPGNVGGGLYSRGGTVK